LPILGERFYSFVYIEAMNLNKFLMVRRVKENMKIMKHMVIKKSNKKKKVVWNVMRPYSTISKQNKENSKKKTQLNVFKLKQKNLLRVWKAEYNQQIGKIIK